MNVGKMNKKITVQKFVKTENENAFEVSQWEDVATVWASARNLSGREFFAAASVYEENTVIFRMRYRPDITAEMRILFNGEHYHINHVDNIEFKNKYMDLKTRMIDKSAEMRD